MLGMEGVYSLGISLHESIGGKTLILPLYNVVVSMFFSIIPILPLCYTPLQP